MHAVVRRHTGAEALAAALTEHQAEVTSLLSTIPGFKSYNTIRSGNSGVVTITICEDKAGTDESVRRAAEWVRANLSGASISPPEISEGDIFPGF